MKCSCSSVQVAGTISDEDIQQEVDCIPSSTVHTTDMCLSSTLVSYCFTLTLRKKKVSKICKSCTLLLVLNNLSL